MRIRGEVLFKLKSIEQGVLWYKMIFCAFFVFPKNGIWPSFLIIKYGRVMKIIKVKTHHPKREIILKLDINHRIEILMQIILYKMKVLQTTEKGHSLLMTWLWKILKDQEIYCRCKIDVWRNKEGYETSCQRMFGGQFRWYSYPSFQNQ